MRHRSRGITRRGFIAGVSGAMAAPMVIPSHVLGGDANVTPNNKITLGAIGIGKMMYGYHLSHFLQIPDVQVVAVCDVDPSRREAGKQRVDEAYDNTECATYVNYQDMLARDDIDAVACATPDHWHALIILDACRAGKDIYCEKPLTNNLREAKLVMDVVNASNIVFQTGSQQRASSNFRYACALVQNGRIGDVKQVTVGVGGPPSPCELPEEETEPGLDWDRWLGPAPMRPYHSALSPRGMHDHFPAWRSYREYGGGGMTDWGAHHFDIAQWGLGMDKSGPVKIIAPEDPTTGTGVKFVYENGVEMTHGGREGVTFIGTEGEIFVSRGKLESTPSEVIQTPIADDDIHLYEAPGGSHTGHRQDWVSCIHGRRQPNCPIETGARTAAICHLGNLVYLHPEQLAGQTLSWDPKRWEFVGNDSANAWQDYPYPRRAGFALNV